MNERLKELIGEEEKDARKMMDMSGIKLSDLPIDMSEEDYRTVFQRVITPEIYAMVVAATVGKALAGSVKAQELIIMQAQGAPPQYMKTESPAELEALKRLQSAMIEAGQQVEYTVISDNEIGKAI